MLNSIKQLGRGIGKELSRTWESLTDGWRELLTRSGDALTHFKGPDSRETPLNVHYLSWGLLPSEVLETEQSIIVRLELPGLDKEDCDISVDGNALIVRGERRQESEHIGKSYYVMERAYGSFQRAVPLPRQVDPDRAQATFRNGVLTVELPKTAGSEPRRIRVG